MANTWVVVADAARARIFERHDNRKLEEIDALVSPQHRLRESDLTTDRAGRAFDSRGGGRHAMERSQSAKAHEASGFAKRLASRVESARLAGEFEKLVLIASPRFLGQLRSSLSKHCREHVVCSIGKELSVASPEEVAEHLPRFL